MDFSDQATVREEQDRAIGLQLVRGAPVRDYPAEVCIACDFATKSNFGKSCEDWANCLQDLQRRERAGR